MRDFFKYTAATVLGLLLCFGVGIGGIIWLLMASASRETGPQVKNGSLLVFDLATEITDAESERTLGQAISAASSGDVPTPQISLRSAVQAIDAATQDAKITGLYLVGNMDSTNTTGYATLKEVRAALQRFRDAGKPIIAYGMDWREREYYIGSIANTIAINPIGSFELNGLSSEPMFYAGALQKFGVGIQVTRVGKYKSAVEPLLLTKMSPENRQQVQTLLNDLWTEVLTTTGKPRQLSVQKMQAIADSKGVLEASEALQSRLVDKVAYADEITADLEKIASKEKDEESSFRHISLNAYADITHAADHGTTHQDHVAVIYAEGEIVAGSGDLDQVGGDRFAAELRRLRKDDKVKAVVLRINSPGGSVTGSDVIQREVILTRKVKPVVVSMGTVAASGGYWIATYSDRIFAEPNTITGSIGVFGIQPNFQQLANNNGVTWDTVKTGRFADVATASRPKSAQELALLQRSVDDIYDQFLTKVAESRKLSRAKVGEVAQGRVWSGLRAKQLGLVDELGGLEAAIQDAAKRAKLGKKFSVQDYPRRRSLEERLFQQLQGASAATGNVPARQADLLTREVKKMQRDLATLQAMNDPRGIYVRLPINFRLD
jgi:protease IV